MNQSPQSILETLQIARRQHAAGHLQQAEEMYRQILQADPSNAAAMHLLGVIAHQLGRHAQSIELIKRSISINPRDPTAYNNLGLAQQALKDYEGAIASYRRAIETLPNPCGAYSNLGAALLRLQRYAESAESCQKALEMKPDFYEALSCLGLALRGLGRYEEAARALQTALQIDPSAPDAWRHLASVQQLAGRVDEAEHCYRELLRLRPTDEATLCGYASFLRSQRGLDQALALYDQALSLNNASLKALLGKAAVYRDQGKFEDAVQASQRALKIDPNDESTYLSLAASYRHRGRYDDAIDVCRRLLQLRPGLAEAHYNLSGVYQDLGVIEQAIDHCLSAIAAQPNYAPAYTSLAGMKRYTAQDDSDLQRIQQRLDSGQVAKDKRYYLHFAMGKILDDMGRYDEAFEHYRIANQEACVAYDAERTQDLFDALIEVYTPQLFQSLEGMGDLSQRPVFIVGMPRSGTTLVEQILSCHTDVCGAGELPDIDLLTVHISQRLGDAGDYPWCMPRLTGQLAGEAAAQYLAQLDRHSPSADRVIDKMPSNFRQLGMIAALLSQARIIHLRRNPLDTCLSCYFTSFVGRLSFAYDLAALGEYYRLYERLMEHWRRVLPIEMHEVDYAQLVEQPEATIRGLVDYCGLNWDPNCLEFHRSDRAVRTASTVQVREPIHRRGLDRWKQYEQHLGPLKESLGLS